MQDLNASLWFAWTHSVDQVGLPALPASASRGRLKACTPSWGRGECRGEGETGQKGQKGAGLKCSGGRDKRVLAPREHHALSWPQSSTRSKASNTVSALVTVTVSHVSKGTSCRQASTCCKHLTICGNAHPLHNVFILHRELQVLKNILSKPFPDF